MFHASSRSESEQRTDDMPLGAQPETANAGDTETNPPEPEEGGQAAPPAGGDSQEAWQAKYQLLQDQFTRLAADFENFRKRVREEQESLVKYGAQKSVLELLPVLDNLERAQSSLNENSDSKTLYKSFEVLSKQLMDSLNAMGVQKIQAVGQPFDPQYHEAINRMESAEFPENTVMYEAQSGYALHDKLVRPAMVVVSTGSAGQAEEPGGASGEEAEAAEKSGQSNPFMK